jgi:hypothetical protein
VLYSLEVLATNVLVFESYRPRIATPALAIRLLDYPSLILRSKEDPAQRHVRDDGAREVRRRDVGSRYCVCACHTARGSQRDTLTAPRRLLTVSEGRRCAGGVQDGQGVFVSRRSRLVEHVASTGAPSTCGIIFPPGGPYSTHHLPCCSIRIVHPRCHRPAA